MTIMRLARTPEVPSLDGQAFGGLDEGFEGKGTGGEEGADGKEILHVQYWGDCSEGELYGI